jgi:hypothetical protein
MCRAGMSLFASCLVVDDCSGHPDAEKAGLGTRNVVNGAQYLIMIENQAPLIING